VNGWLVALAILGLLQGAFTLVVVAFLLNRVLRPLREISRDADETLAYGLAITRNLDGADEAERTRELVMALTPHVKARFGKGDAAA
jgi:HAMP domain-containing protein